MERSKAESDRRDTEYKGEQIELNRRLVTATVALVAATILLGSLQIWYMHHQYKLTSDGLSKMGDEIWAAKDAAYASKAASDTASRALQTSQQQFKNTLGQMQGQTTAQNKAATAAESAATTAKNTLHVSERAYVVIGGPQTDTTKKIVTIPIVNSGHIPSGPVNVTLHHAIFHTVPDIRLTFRDVLGKHWKHQHLSSVSPALPLTITIPIQEMDEVSLNGGHQAIFIAGYLVYNDGFPDTGDQRRAFCTQTFYEITVKQVVWIECDASDLIPKLESMDGYPQNEDK